MAEKTWMERIFNRPKNRREFIGEQIKYLLVGAMFPWPLSSMMSVKVRGAEDSDSKPTPPPPPNPPKEAKGFKGEVSEKPVGPVHPLAKQFLGEKLAFDITFLGVVTAATGVYQFNRGPGKSYTGSMEAKASGVVGKLTKHRRQKLESKMSVRTVDGKDRFVTNIHETETKKGADEYHTFHIMDYKRKRWVYRKYKNEKLVKKRIRKIAHNGFYDDFVVITYNFRAGIYGAPELGRQYTLNTLPYKKVDRFTFHIADETEMSKKNDLVKDFPGTKFIIVVDIDQKIFGMKTGTAYFMGDKNLRPLGVSIREVVSFGDVVAKLKK